MTTLTGRVDEQLFVTTEEYAKDQAGVEAKADQAVLAKMSRLIDRERYYVLRLCEVRSSEVSGQMLVEAWGELTLLNPEEAKIGDLVYHGSISTQSDQKEKEVRVGGMIFHRYERLGCKAWQRVS